MYMSYHIYIQSCCKITITDLCSLFLLALLQLLSYNFLSCRGRTGAVSKPSNRGIKGQLSATKSEKEGCPKTVQTVEGKTLKLLKKAKFIS